MRKTKQKCEKNKTEPTKPKNHFFPLLPFLTKQQIQLEKLLNHTNHTSSKSTVTAPLDSGKGCDEKGSPFLQILVRFDEKGEGANQKISFFYSSKF